jgi:hypothetical protein
LLSSTGRAEISLVYLLARLLFTRLTRIVWQPVSHHNSLDADGASLRLRSKLQQHLGGGDVAA